jgi:hypothetical protein
MSCFGHSASPTVAAILGLAVAVGLAAPAEAVPLAVQQFIAADNDYYGFAGSSREEVGRQTDTSP